MKVTTENYRELDALWDRAAAESKRKNEKKVHIERTGGMVKEIEWRWDDNWIVLAGKGCVQFEWYPIRPRWTPAPVPEDNPQDDELVPA